MALVNVIRAAVSKIQDNERILLNAQPDIAVSGPVVNDALHLFAELTENATSFSAVDMPVEISGYLMNSGVVIDITDRGVGMSAKELSYANWRLENPPTGDIDVPKWIGLFVVARLAARPASRSGCSRRSSAGSRRWSGSPTKSSSITARPSRRGSAILVAARQGAVRTRQAEILAATPWSGGQPWLGRPS